MSTIHNQPELSPAWQKVGKVLAIALKILGMLILGFFKLLAGLFAFSLATTPREEDSDDLNDGFYNPLYESKTEYFVRTGERLDD